MVVAAAARILIANIALLFHFLPLKCRLRPHVCHLGTATVPLKTVDAPLTEERIPPECSLVPVGFTGKAPERPHNSGKQ